jgi:hypothetical protein
MNESTTARRDGNTLKHFDAMNPTKAQLRDMGRILALASVRCARLQNTRAGSNTVEAHTHHIHETETRCTYTASA